MLKNTGNFSDIRHKQAKVQPESNEEPVDNSKPRTMASRIGLDVQMRAQVFIYIFCIAYLRWAGVGLTENLSLNR